MDDRFTHEEKKLILAKKGYKLDEGFLFHYEAPENAVNIFVSKKEVEEKLKAGFVECYWNENNDLRMDVSDMFEYFIDQLFHEDEVDNDINDVNLEGHIRQKYLS